MHARPHLHPDRRPLSFPETDCNAGAPDSSKSSSSGQRRGQNQHLSPCSLPRTTLRLPLSFIPRSSPIDCLYAPPQHVTLLPFSLCEDLLQLSYPLSHLPCQGKMVTCRNSSLDRAFHTPGPVPCHAP
ncbi:hypothetical protein XELAEV_18038482mg [Xenopus laevis]|uniref:Uncharacterized protein n=1 Tax=Xenopus laevis TaxID=8355 RepID=A0A974C5T9_XENLA|nr:hypothetical protein XELAEV_18038482mg [Xenopus laevis]